MAVILSRHIPASLAEQLMTECGVPFDRRTSSLKRAERMALVEALTSYPLPWSGNEGYKKAEVTGGGIKLADVDLKTLESRQGRGAVSLWRDARRVRPHRRPQLLLGVVHRPRRRSRRRRREGATFSGARRVADDDLDTRRAVGGPADLQRLVGLHPLFRSQLLRPRHQNAVPRAVAVAVSRHARRHAHPSRINGACSPSGWCGAIESVTGLDPHVIDVALKTLALAASTALLYLFSTTLVSTVGAVLAAVLYLFVTAAAFSSEGYAIYFTNDYLAVLSWFAGALAVRHRAWMLAALAAFAGAWAKETAVLIVFLVTFEALRKRAPWGAVILCAIAFAIPTATLRIMYPAPLAQWAWWDTFKLNVPFVTWEGTVIAKSLRDNLKVILFLNVVWWWAWRAWRRTQDAYLTSLALTLACYVVLAWMVVYIRELRHMLPFTIFVIPMAVAELEAAGQRRP